MSCLINKYSTHNLRVQRVSFSWITHFRWRWRRVGLRGWTARSWGTSWWFRRAGRRRWTCWWFRRPRMTWFQFWRHASNSRLTRRLYFGNFFHDHCIRHWWRRAAGRTGVRRTRGPFVTRTWRQHGNARQVGYIHARLTRFRFRTYLPENISLDSIIVPPPQAH